MGTVARCLTPDFAAARATVYGLTLWQTKGIAAGTALVADPAQIVVAVRTDPTVAVSTDAMFTPDGRCAAWSRGWTAV